MIIPHTKEFTITVLCSNNFLENIFKYGRRLELKMITGIAPRMIEREGGILVKCLYIDSILHGVLFIFLIRFLSSLICCNNSLFCCSNTFFSSL